MNTKDKSGIASILKSFKLTGTLSGASTGIDWLNTSGEILKSYSPIDSNLIGSIKQASSKDYEKVVDATTKAFIEWRKIPSRKEGK